MFAWTANNRELFAYLWQYDSFYLTEDPEYVGCTLQAFHSVDRLEFQTWPGDILLL